MGVKERSKKIDFYKGQIKRNPKQVTLEPSPDSFLTNSYLNQKPVLITKISHYARRHSLDSTVYPRYIFLCFLHLRIHWKGKLLQWDTICHDIICKTIWGLDYQFYIPFPGVLPGVTAEMLQIFWISSDKENRSG